MKFLQESLKRGKPKEKSAEMLAKEATRDIKDEGRDLVAQRMSNTFSRGVMMSPKNVQLFGLIQPPNLT